MTGKDGQGYTQRFNALARLLPYLVTPESLKMNRYVWGLEPRVCRYVKAAQQASMKSAIELAAIVTDDMVRSRDFQGEDGKGKKKVDEGRRQIAYGTERVGQKRGRNDQREQHKGKKLRVHQGVTPTCNKCHKRHSGECRANTCLNCRRKRRTTTECRLPNQKKCYECEAADNFHRNCPTLARQGTGGAQGRAFVMDGANVRAQPDVVMGTFLLDIHPVSVLFETGTSGSFIATNLRHLFETPSHKLNVAFEVELAMVGY